MRLTLKLLLKVVAIFGLLLIVLPLWLNRLDRDTNKKTLHRDSVDSKVNVPDLKVNKDQDQGKNINEEDGGAQLPPPDKRQENGNKEESITNNDDSAPIGFEPVVYGPKSVFKDGIIGNYEPKFEPKTGPGEMGKPVYLSMSDRSEADRSIGEFGFNMVASDKIAMNRNIPDTRLDECKYWHYPETLPTASVIIVFHNEGWSSLLRTVHSVINNSPPQLLHEVVMVDDFSSKAHLGQKLQDYIDSQFKGLVKLYRNKERLGLIRTRTLGAKYSKGDVIVFLDAHCECNRNWLPPLLARISYDRTIMTVPTIDGIDWNTFQYSPVYQDGQHYRGIFEWGFLYKESSVPEKILKSRKYNSEPYQSPTHAGGLFAMDRKYFFELGAYDPGLLIWGGENFELSFKIWQCGGSIEWVPCSRVGHVYRNSMPYGFGNINPQIPIILINYMRVVEVWLDDKYKEYFYTREPTIRGYPIGNITDQLEFKKKHKCRSFDWFMKNIAYEVFDRFPALPPNVGWGEITQKDSPNPQCWDTQGQPLGGGSIGVSPCHHLGGNQMFRLNEEGQIGVGERCIREAGNVLQLNYCPVHPTGPWKLDKETGLITHNGGKCVGFRGYKLKLVTCDKEDSAQLWSIKEVRTWKK